MRVKETLNTIVKKFEEGDVPEAVALTCFPLIDVPMSRWSLLNRLIVFFSGSKDARGFRQWNQIGRYPKKGSKAIYIFAPIIVKKGQEQENNSEAQEETPKTLSGFTLVPVFRLEDTNGKPLEYPDLSIPAFPLIKRAEEWGINITAVSGNSYSYGAYSQKRKEIILASPEESVFFHELCHSAHHRIKGKLIAGQDWGQEIVAELGAVALCKLVGKEPDKALGNGYRYIAKYAEDARLSVISAIMRVLSDTEEVLNLILKGGDSNAIQTDCRPMEKRR